MTAESAALLAPLLSLPGEQRYGVVDLTVEQRSERIFTVLLAQLLGLAAREPVLYILEDAHWADPTTRELITRTLGSIGNARVLLLITHRPDFQPDWVRHPQVTALTLGRLSRGQGSAVVRAAGGAALPDAVVARILQRADGVPLYIEELTPSVVETDDPHSDTAIPETLQASLLARLDRLGGEAKELAQIAAVIGREFAAALLSAVSGKPGDAVDRSLHRLLTSGDRASERAGARRRLRLPPRLDPGRGLPIAAGEPAPPLPRPDRAGAGAPLPGPGGRPARPRRPALHGCRIGRASNPLLVKGGRSGQWRVSPLASR